MSTKKNTLIGLELDQEWAYQALEVQGEVPIWLNGTLVRNGPINLSIDGKRNEHWFDGLAMPHAFQFGKGKLHYSNRFLRTDAYKTVMQNHALDYEGFAVDPCRALFKSFFSWFLPHPPHLHNANVNLAKIANQYVALTEVPLPVKFDVQTLDTLGVLDYQDRLPKDGCWESAHPHQDKHLQETWNYIVDFGFHSHYLIYRIRGDSSEREIVAKIPVKNPAYMHSFSLTKNYILLTQYPFLVRAIDLVLHRQPFIKNYDWHPEKGTIILVIDRQSGKLIKEWQTTSFFAFHHVNAFEQGDFIYLDIVCYDNANIISDIGNYFRAGSKVNTNRPILQRFTLNLSNSSLEKEVLFAADCEFPRINADYDGKPYRYVYLIDPKDGFSEEDRRSIYKVDVKTKEVLAWSKKGCYPGEAVFVASPDAVNEDDGVILSLLLDPLQHFSYLTIIDAKNMQEIAEAKVQHYIPPGLHGQFFV